MFEFIMFLLFGAFFFIYMLPYREQDLKSLTEA